MDNYFSHDYHSRSDPKIVSLLMEKGMEGYGIFWGIVEMLYQQDGYLQAKYERIAYELRTSPDLVKIVVNGYGLFKIKGDKIYSESVLKRVNLRNEKSAKARESVSYRWNKPKDDTNVLRTQNDSNTINKRKRKEKKEKIIKPDGWQGHEEVKEYIKTHFPKLLEMKKPLTYENHRKLGIKFGKEAVGMIYSEMENWKFLTTKNDNAYLTALNWLRKREKQ